jgi:type IV pilus assembly protein PilM
MALRLGGSGDSVALDIGTSGLAAVVLRRGRHGVRLVRAAACSLPPGLVAGGEVADVDELAPRIKRFWREEKLPGRRVRLAVAGHRVFVRVMEMPHIEDAGERRAAVEFAAGEQVPIPLHEAILDYVVLPRGDAAADAPDRIVVAAAQRAMIDSMVAAVRAAGLRPVGIDLKAFALLRALLGDAQFDALGRPPGAQVVCDVGGSETNVVVAVDRQCQFTRLVGFGGTQLTAAVAERTGLSFDEAEALKVACGLLGEIGEGWDEEQVRAVRHALALGARPLVEEIRRSLDYYGSQGFARPIERIVITGGTSRCAGLDRYLQQGLGIPVAVGDPLLNVDGGEVSPDLAARAAVAVGLALEGGEGA